MAPPRIFPGLRLERLSSVAFMSVALLGWHSSVRAEDITDKALPGEFATWAENALEKSTSIESCRVIRDRLLHRLGKGMEVYDATVQKAVQAFANAEFGSSPRQAGDPGTPGTYKESMALARELRSLLPHRTLLVSWLHFTEGTWLQFEGRDAKSLDQFSAARKVHDQLRVELGVLFVENLVKLGATQISLGNRKESDEAYLEVLRFEFFKLGDELKAMPSKEMEFSRRFASSYELAVEGLMKTRYGDAEKLRDLKRRLVFGFRPQFEGKIDELIGQAEAQTNKQQ